MHTKPGIDDAGGNAEVFFFLVRDARELVLAVANLIG
jgi:hypothetical protein